MLGISVNAFIQSFGSYLQFVAEFFLRFTNPADRLFFVFPLTSGLAAFLVFYYGNKAGSFRAFLFPKQVWSNPTAWLDVRYFFFHGLIGHFLLKGIGLMFLASGLYWSAGIEPGTEVASASMYSTNLSLVIAIVFFFVLALVSDFVGFALHYLQHKVPFLWQFHKVHHAGEVMHPLSNFREHPVDNLLYAVFIQFITGISVGLMLRVFGYMPSVLQILGVSVLSLMFNLVAYHLRHSHIWLRWPGVWSKVFPSPAHHQVHHSRHPDHLDKNFAFRFPIWDVIFGTYVMPEDNRDIEFGIVEDASDLNSCVNLYLVPFRDAWRVLKKDQDLEETATKPSASSSLPVK